MENAEEKKPSPVIDKLLMKLDASPGFAGLEESVQTICRLVDGDGGDTGKIAATLLRDAKPGGTSPKMRRWPKPWA